MWYYFIYLFFFVCVCVCIYIYTHTHPERVNIYIPLECVCRNMNVCICLWVTEQMNKYCHYLKEVENDLSDQVRQHQYLVIQVRQCNWYCSINNGIFVVQQLQNLMKCSVLLRVHWIRCIYVCRWVGGGMGPVLI